MTTTLYGISNCDTVKKARKWLADHNIAADFHDYRKDGLELSWLTETEQHLGWESLLNKRGTTFRQLPDDQKTGLDREKALALLMAHPAMIKRPVLIHQGQYWLGFSAQSYEDIFA